MNLPALSAKGWTDYELMDSGDGQKMERFGPVVLARQKRRRPGSQPYRRATG